MFSDDEKERKRLLALESLLVKGRTDALRLQVRKILATRIAYGYRFMQKNFHNRCLLLEIKRKLVNQAESRELNL